MNINADRTILVVGATGYVGGRLIPRLLEAGYRVRAMGRSMQKLAARQWSCHSRVELFQGDVQTGMPLSRPQRDALPLTISCMA